MATKTIESSTIVCQTADTVSAHVNGETLMMGMAKGNYYSLDPISSRIWELIDQPIAVSAVCDKLLTEFDVDREACLRDVIEFFNGLAEEELIVVVK